MLSTFSAIHCVLAELLYDLQNPTLQFLYGCIRIIKECIINYHQGATNKWGGGL